jgi:hypothetical protein
MPDGEIIGTPDQPVLFNGRSSAASGYTTSGTVELARALDVWPLATDDDWWPQHWPPR